MYPPQPPQSQQPMNQQNWLQGLAGLLMQQGIMRDLFGDASMMNPAQGMPSPQTAPPSGQGSGAIGPLGISAPGARSPQAPLPAGNSPMPTANPPPGALPSSRSARGGMGRFLGGGPISGGYRVSEDPQEQEGYEAQSESGQYLIDEFIRRQEERRQREQMDEMLEPSAKEQRARELQMELEEINAMPEGPEKDAAIDELSRKIEELEQME